MPDLIKTLTIPIAIIAICIIECVALAHGINGTLLIVTIAIISGLAGYKVPDIISKVKNKNKKE